MGWFKMPHQIIDHAVSKYAPPIVKQIHAVSTAPMRSTAAADPILSWAQTGKFSSHGARTRAGVHELYKHDKLAQKLGIKENDVVAVVEIAQVVVAIYFGGALLGAWGGAGGAVAAPVATGAATGTAAAAGGTAAGGGILSTIGAGASKLAAGAATTAVSTALKPKPALVPVAQPAIALESKRATDNGGAMVALGGLAVLAKFALF